MYFIYVIFNKLEKVIFSWPALYPPPLLIARPLSKYTFFLAASPRQNNVLKGSAVLSLLKTTADPFGTLFCTWLYLLPAEFLHGVEIGTLPGVYLMAAG